MKHWSLMARETRKNIMEVAWPVFALLGLLIKTVYAVLFSWWLDRLLQARDDRALWRDVHTYVYFLAAQGVRVESRHTRVLPFDYASVSIDLGNVRVCITRGNWDSSFLIGPLSSPDRSYELVNVVLTLAPNVALSRREISDLLGLGSLFEQHWDEINNAFSKKNYPAFEERLEEASSRNRIILQQTRWEPQNAQYRP